MSDLELVVISLQSKIEKLIHLHKKHEEENTRLLFEKNQQQISLELQQKRIKDLEQQLQATENTARLSAAEKLNYSAQKEKIDKIVKEIEECIGLINKD